ncbi:unnamed protein product [Bursaphelenchus xylophilus]|nr:unnamed protein product [Bursaphelenchus xylophilus]CAG9084487.1 unnamed protein product [Bursaphelenchus xylophilus]
MCGSKKRLGASSEQEEVGERMSNKRENINVLDILLNTEKKSQKLIEEARQRKREKATLARHQAMEEIRVFKELCQGKFEEKTELKMREMEEFKSIIEQQTKDKLYFILCTVNRNKQKVVDMLLDALTNVIPEVHRNLAAQIDIGRGRFEPRRPQKPLTLFI